MGIMTSDAIHFRPFKSRMGLQAPESPVVAVALEAKLLDRGPDPQMGVFARTVYGMTRQTGDVPRLMDAADPFGPRALLVALEAETVERGRGPFRRFADFGEIRIPFVPSRAGMERPWTVTEFAGVLEIDLLRLGHGLAVRGILEARHRLMAGQASVGTHRLLTCWRSGAGPACREQGHNT